MRILQVESSARVKDSASRKLSDAIVARLAGAFADARIERRDLAAEPLPHVDEDFVRAMFITDDAATPADRAALARSDALIAELRAADVVVIGAPMYNYGVPSALKAWIDHVVRARRTFRHTPSGPMGLLADRPVWIATASGGVYSDGPAAAHDFLTPYLRAVLGKIGLRSLEVLAIEGLALDPDPEAAIERGLRQFDDRLASVGT